MTQSRVSHSYLLFISMRLIGLSEKQDAFIEDLVPFYREACSTENGFLFLETFVKIYLKKFAFLSGEETDYQREVILCGVSTNND